MTCVNCSTEGDGRFCSNCGQRLHVKRLTWKEGWHDFWARIYGFDGMFPRTFRDLTVRPGFAAREFIRGNRARYYGPVGYFFLTITCFLLLLGLIGLNYVDYLKEMQEAIPVTQENARLNSSVRGFVADNLKLVAFIVIPFQAFVSRYFFFRKQELNFLEHAVLPLYITGHWYWLQMVEAISFKITHASIGTLWHGLLMGFYMGFAYTSFVPSQPKWKTFFKGFGIYVTSFLMFMLVLFVLAFAAIIIIGLVDPSALDSIRPSKVR